MSEPTTPVPAPRLAVDFDEQGHVRAQLVPLTADELADWQERAAAPPPPPPPPPLPEQIGAALAGVDPATATVADVLQVLRPLFPTPDEGG